MRRGDITKPAGIIYNLPHLSGVRVYHGGSNKTDLSRTTGKLCFICPICKIEFLKPAAWAKRCQSHCCSRACASENRKVRVITHCIICKIQMEKTPSNSLRVLTCGKECSSIRRRSLRGNDPRKTKKSSFAAYIKKVHEISKISICIKCGSECGPWAVRGLLVSLDATLAPIIDATHAELWCTICHLKSVAPLGSPVREAKKHAKHIAIQGE